MKQCIWSATMAKNAVCTHSVSSFLLSLIVAIDCCHWLLPLIQGPLHRIQPPLQHLSTRLFNHPTPATETIPTRFCRSIPCPFLEKIPLLSGTSCRTWRVVTWLDLLLGRQRRTEPRPRARKSHPPSTRKGPSPDPANGTRQKSVIRIQTIAD